MTGFLDATRERVSDNLENWVLQEREKKGGEDDSHTP
jgi:hypothetical protein